MCVTFKKYMQILKITKKTFKKKYVDQEIRTSPLVPKPSYTFQQNLHDVIWASMLLLDTDSTRAAAKLKADGRTLRN